MEKELYLVSIPYYVMARSQKEAETMNIDIMSVLTGKRHAERVVGIWQEWADLVPLNSDSNKTVWEEHLKKDVGGKP